MEGVSISEQLDLLQEKIENLLERVNYSVQESKEVNKNDGRNNKTK